MERVLNRDVFILVAVCVVSMVIGAALAHAGSTSTSSVTSTRVVSVTNADGASSVTTLPASTVTVTDTTTKTVTKTKTTPASTSAPPQTSSASFHGKTAYTFSGNGGTTLAPFRVWHPATLEWTNSGDIYQLFTTDGQVLVNSQASSGSTYLAPQSYTIQVNGIGTWTLKVVYR